MRLKVYRCEICGREYEENFAICECGAMYSIYPDYEDLCDYCGNSLATIGKGDVVICEECYKKEVDDL